MGSDFQEMFVKAITTEDESSKVEALIEPVGQLNTQDVLRVYRQDYQARLTQALEETYEGVWSALGDDLFFEICKDYLSQNPSQTNDLGQIGLLFPKYIATHQLATDYPFLPLLANFEQDFWALFHAKKEMINNNELELPQPDELLNKRFQFISNLKMFSWEYKIYDMWSHRKEGFAEPLSSFHSQQNIILFKSQSLVQAVNLSSDQWRIFSLLHSGSTLNQALEHQEISPEELQVLFQALQSNKLILEI